MNIFEIYGIQELIDTSFSKLTSLISNFNSMNINWFQLTCFLKNDSFLGLSRENEEHIHPLNFSLRLCDDESEWKGILREQLKMFEDDL